MIKLLLDKQIFASSDAIMAATRKILSTTHAILALTWFCHLSILVYLWSLGGAWGAPRGDPPPHTWKKLQCLKMIFRPFGEKEIKKNWIWKMTLANPFPPSLEFSIIFFFWTLPLDTKAKKCNYPYIYFVTNLIYNKILHIHAMWSN